MSIFFFFYNIFPNSYLQKNSINNNSDDKSWVKVYILINSAFDELHYSAKNLRTQLYIASIPNTQLMELLTLIFEFYQYNLHSSNYALNELNLFIKAN